MIKQQKLIYYLLTACMLTTMIPKSEAEPRFGAKGISQSQVNISRTIKGVIKSAKGQPVVGATVASASGDRYAVTGLEGEFSIQVKGESETFQVMCLGYKNSDFTAGKADTYTIVLEEENMTLDETVVVGYGVQKKATVTGAVASIVSDDLIKTKNTNVQNMLTGRVPGLRVVQKTSEPGDFSMHFDIRGFGAPLVIVDGIPRGNMAKLDPNEIESISILKDASAAVYGVKAANGVVLITTKSGDKDGKVNISYNGNMTWQMISGLPESVDIVTHMRMLNEKSMTSSDGNGFLKFDEEFIQKYISGEKQGTDWFDAAIRQFVPQTQHNLSVSGGNKKISFFTNIGYQYQEGFFTYGNLNYDRFNVRTKVSAEIVKGLKFDINVNGILDKKDSPRFRSAEIINELWKSNPLDPIYAKDSAPYYQRMNNDTGINTLAWLNRDITGYNNRKGNVIQSSASLTYDIPGVTGLSLKALYGYDYNMGTGKTYKKSYHLYTYDEQTQTLNEFTKDAPSSVRRNYSEGSKSIYQVSVNYHNKFKDAHNVNALLLLEGQHSKGDGFYALRELSLDVDHLFAGNSENQVGAMSTGDIYEYSQMGLVGKFAYDYKGKYLAEFMFRYDGSSKFEKSHRFGFFPSASVGYRVSEENFWKNSPLKFINNLKVRASYGIMGDDGALAYQFLSGYTYPNSMSFFGGKPVNGVANMGIPNKNITWYTSHTMNFGVDMEAWNGKLGMTFDFFQRSRYGLLATRKQTLPGTVGAALPQENINADRTFGYEIELSHKNYVNSDFYYSVKGNLSVTRARNLYIESSEYRSHMHNWRNNSEDRYKGIWWGIEGDGLYQSWEDIAESEVKVSRGQLPGNYKYKDWNGDGFIDDNDLHPMGYNSVPLMNFGFIFDLGFHGFDLNLLFQGAALSNVQYSEKLANPTTMDYAPLDFWADRWRPAEIGADPFKYDTEWIKGKYPSVGGSLVKEKSSFNIHNGAYLRLKNIELGYTLPKKLLSKANIKDCRFFVSGYNLLTFSGIKFVDPEHPSDDHGYMYPLNKTVTVGLNLKF